VNETLHLQEIDIANALKCGVQREEGYIGCRKNEQKIVKNEKNEKYKNIS
jgi:hypothetical protein